MREFNYNQLISFVKVAEHLNISEAAKQLNKSRATISEHVDALECDLGHKLFDRSSRQFKLTPFGEKVFSPSQLLISQIGFWQNTVERNCPDRGKVVLRIAYDGVVPKKVIQKLIEHCDANEMDVEFISLSANFAPDCLDNKTVDLVIAPNEESAILDEYEWRIIGVMPYRFYAHKDFFDSKYIERCDLLSHKQILPRAYLNKGQDHKFIFTPNNKIINDSELLLSALDRKVGWAFLPVHMETDSWENIVEIETSLGGEGFVTPVQLFWRSGEELLVSPILKYFENGNVIQANE